MAADLDGKTASIRDAKTLEKLVTLAGHGQVLAVGVSPDGRRVATGSADGTARLWNAATGREVHARPPGRRPGHSVQRGRHAARDARRRRRCAGLGRSNRPELRSFANVHERTVKAAWGEGVAFVGRDRIAVAPWARGSTPSPVVAKVLDVSSGNQVEVIKDPRGVTKIFDIDVSPDGTLLVAGQAEGTELQLYALPSGEQLDVVRAAHGVGILDVEFSGDGRLVATGGVDATAKVWEDVDEEGSRPDAPPLLRPAASRSTARDRGSSRGGRPGEAKSWDVTPAGRGEVLTLPGPDTDEHPDIAFTPDGRRLVATSGPRGRCGSGAPKPESCSSPSSGTSERGPSSASTSAATARASRPPAPTAAPGSSTPRREAAARRPRLHCLSRRRCGVNRAVFSPDGARIATTGLDSTVRILDAAPAVSSACSASPSGRLRHVPGRVEPRRKSALGDGAERNRHLGSRTFRKLRALPPTGTPATSAVWSPDGSRCSSKGARRLRLRRVERRAAAHPRKPPGPVGAGLQSRRARLAVGTVFLGGYVNRILDWPTPRAASL